MTTTEPAAGRLDALDLRRYDLLASTIVGRPIVVVWGSGRTTTDGTTIQLDPRFPARARDAVVVQSALLAAGALDHDVVRPLRRRPARLRSHLEREVPRCVGLLALRLPAARRIDLTGDREWWGEIHPGSMRTVPDSAPPVELDVDAVAGATPDPDAGFDEPGRPDPFGRRVGVPARRARRRALGSRRASAGAAVLTDAPVRAHSVREAPDVRVVSHGTGPILEDVDDRRGRTVGTYPEWDEHGRRYRAEWCRVREVPVGGPPPGTEPPVPYAPLVRRRIVELHLEHTRLGHQLDGEELDLDAVIEQEIRRRSGDQPDELVYASRRRRGRDLGVLVLVDASASTAKGRGTEGTVAARQREAAAVLVDAFRSAGDRVACHAFRSHGRRSVEFSAVKHFDDAHAAHVQRTLGRIRPEGFTRLGAAVRHATELLVSGAGTRRWLLIVLSDAFPFDLEYEGVVAAADSRRALLEARRAGVGCLCLSLGTAADDAELRDVFGSSTFASASTISELDADLTSLAATALALADRRRQLATAAARRAGPSRGLR